jgi:hypothetical protein
MQAGAISQLRTFPGTATDALRLRTSPVASVDGAVKFWPDVSKTRLLIEGARVLTGVQRDEVATTTFRLLDRRLHERHAHAGPACLVVNNEFFHSRVSPTNSPSISAVNNAKIFGRRGSEANNRMAHE